MHSRSLCVLLRCLLLCSAFMLPARAQEASPEVLSFEQDILPLLRQNCLACHNSQLPEGGLNLESLALTKKGGDSGAAVTAKDLDNSLLWVRAAATEKDEVMPPMDNAVGAKRLTKEELDRLRRWIEQGAEAGEMGKGHQIVWQPIPEAQRAIYALDISPTDQLVACSRANRVTLYDLHTRAEVAKLVDPTLESEVGPGVADVAAINALAFSPDGRRLATGGFRTVRIWEQQAAVLPLPPGLHQRSPAMVLASSRAQVATVNSLGDVEIRDVNSGALLSRLVGQTAAIACLDWGAEALDLLVSGDVSGQIQLWRPSSEELLTELNCASSLQEIVLSADARFLAAVGEDGKVYCYRLTWGESGAGQGHVQAESVSVDFLAGVSCIEILQTSVPYLLAAAGQQVEVIDLNTATKVKSWGHETQVTAMLAHDAHVFTGSLDGTVQKWSLTSEERQGTVATDFVGQSMLSRWQADVARQTKTVDRLVEKSKQLQAALEKEVKALEAVQEARDKAAASSEESQQKLAAAQEKVVQSEAAIQKATTERGSIQQRVVASAARIEGQEAERRKVADALAEQRKQREQLARMLAEVDQMLEKYETQDAQLESQINESKKEREVASQAEQQLTEELATYQKQLEAGKKELTAATEARKAAEAELSKREQALATSQQGKTRVEASIPVHESKLARERSQQGHLERELSRVNEAHYANRAVIDLALSPSGEKLALARRGGRIQFLTLGTGQVIESSLPTCDGIQFFSET